MRTFRLPRFSILVLLVLLMASASAMAEDNEFNNIALSAVGSTAYDNGSFDDYGTDQDAMLAIDGDPGTYWAGLEPNSPQVMTIGFASTQLIDQVRIQENRAGSYFTDADFEYFRGSWKPLFSIQKTQPNFDQGFDVVVADSIRITIHDLVAPSSWYNQVACISEFEVHGIAELDFNVALDANGSWAYDNGQFNSDTAAAMAIDGSYTSYWAGYQNAAPQVMTVGFENSYQIDRIRIWEFYGGGGISYFTDADFEFYDGNSWNHLFNFQKSEPHMDYRFPTVIADSVRIVVNDLVAPGSWYNKVACISEFEVSGSEIVDVFGNMALSSMGATAYDNGYFDDYGNDLWAQRAIDGDPMTYWAGLVSAAPQRMTIGFVRTLSINRIAIQENYPGGVSYFNEATFEFYDGTDWVLLFDASKSAPGFDQSFAPVIADSVRITINALTAPGSWYNQVACISEFEVYSNYVADVGPGITTLPLLISELSNFPNPFNPITNIRFNLAQDANVSIDVYDIRGRLIKRLYDGLAMQGENNVVWNGVDTNNRRVASGTYLCRVRAGSIDQVIKVKMVK